MPEQSQVEQTADGQAEATESQVESTTDVVEQVGQLLGNQPEPEEVQEEKIEEKVEAQEPKEEVQAKTQEPVIDDAMIEKYPRLKMYLGKPIMDLPKAYDNVVLAYQKDHLELLKIKQEQAKNSLKTSEVPDSIEEKEKFEKWLAERDDKIRQQAILEAQNQPKPVDWVSEVAKVLPPETDVKNVIDGFTKFNATRFYNELGELRPEPQAFYDNHPEVLLEEIRAFHNLSSNANKNKSVIEKESKDTAYKTITNSLKKAQENKDDLQLAQFNATERSTQAKPEDVILANIFKIAQGQ